MYCCTSHVFPLESGGRNCSSCSCHSVYLAHWFILTDISTSNFSADNLLKVIEFGPPFSSLIAKGSWIVNTLRVSLPLTHWKKYRSFVDDNYFFFAVQKHRQVLWCQPGTQEYFEILFFFRLLCLKPQSKNYQMELKWLSSKLATKLGCMNAREKYIKYAGWSLFCGKPNLYFLTK